MASGFVFLDIQTILDIHEIESRRRGTAEGVRDIGLLESAVARAQGHASYAEVVTPFSISASLAYGIARNHPFIDGNKRTSFTAALTVLALNGYELRCSPDMKIGMWRRLAEGGVREETLAKWLETHCGEAS